MPDLYSVLSLSRRASSKDIKAAYWALAKLFHPDVNASDQEAEGWIKEINHAYEILGDPDARTAYDLELAGQRAEARRSFWRAAATGAATFMLMAGSISMAVAWKQHAVQTGNKTEMPVAKAPAQADPSEPVSALLRGPSSELSASTSSQITSTAPTDREARTSAIPAPSSVVMEQAPKEAEPSPAPTEPSRTDLQEGQPVPQAPPDWQPLPRAELANVVTPEVEAKQPAPTATVDQRSSREPPRRNGDRKAGAVRSIHKKPKKRFDQATVAAARTPNKLQGSEQGPRLVSSGAAGLRWPSAE
jgi:curved DNA-binding protein CbpA